MTCLRAERQRGCCEPRWHRRCSEAIRVACRRAGSCNFRKDGSRYWAEVMTTPIREREGRLIGFAKIIRDLTERRRWEIASDEVGKFRAIVHNAASIIMLLDGAGRIQSVSAAITRLLGHDQELVEGRPLVEFAAAHDRGAVARPQSAAAEDAILGLLRLGYGRADAERAVRGVIESGNGDGSVPALLRSALAAIGNR